MPYNFEFIQMIDEFVNLHAFLQNNQITFRKNGFKEIIDNYDFVHISEMENISENEIKKINQNLANSQLMIISQLENPKKGNEEKYLIIGFENTLIALDYSSISFLSNILIANTNLTICFLPRNEVNKSILDDKEKIYLALKKYYEFQKQPEDKVSEEIKILKNAVYPSTKNSILSKAIEFISGYMIQKCHFKYKKNRINYFIHELENDSKPLTIYENDYVELSLLDSGSISSCFLIFHIKRCEFYALKKPNGNDNENHKCLEREIYNYSMLINHPFFPRFIGTVYGLGYIVIEFINGKTLKDIDTIKLTFDEKIKIIFELLIIIKYLQDKQLIYRDLKPGNVMIDENKNAVLIDLDRLIYLYDESERTTDLGAKYFTAPEVVNEGKFSFKSDIYSLGKMINYIMKQENNSIIDNIFKGCIDDVAEKRPSISSIIEKFNKNFKLEVEIDQKKLKYEEHFSFLDTIHKILQKHESIQNDPDAQYHLGIFYYEGIYVSRDINKSIHYYSLASAKNHPYAQYYLGVIYHEGKYIKRDIEKAIHYYSLASDQNISGAQYRLGIIYSGAQFIPVDITKAIHYFSLASEQNVAEASFFLGDIYLEGKYVDRDIDKAIYYYSRSSDQNYHGAQLVLGLIYYEDFYVSRDIEKAIYFFTQASDHNNPEAQYYLGIIYYDGDSIDRDINKAIYYLSLASDQNYPDAQYYLGIIYYCGKYVDCDTNKAIYYLSLASDQNYPEAQYFLGHVFYDGTHVKIDINKAIQYFTLASNQNHPEAQYCLGTIYERVQVKRDIQKAIYYYWLSANQNYSDAQFALGFIYFDNTYVPRDMNKAIYYYKLASLRNHKEAQYNLGVIYYMGLHVPVDIKNAIHYLELASKNNYIKASFILGSIFCEGKYFAPDIDKSIYYFTIAANHGYTEAQFNLGVMYYEKKYLCHDIKKSIYYYSLAAKKNFVQAMHNLGFIYYEGLYIPRDIKKSIYYFTLASNLNFKESQLTLGIIYSENKYIKIDIDKSINYYTLAANQNNPLAQFALGCIYRESKYGKMDINKSIYYFKLSSKQKYSLALFNLGAIYFEGKCIKRDINQSINYYLQASNLNLPDAQLNLGLIYYEGKFIQKDIKKGINYIMLASKNGCRQANFAHAFLLHEGKNINRNMIDAIHYYKEASSMNNQYAKNNLGIIYKYGFEDKIKPRIFEAIEYFEEAIRQKEDCLSIYNLAHIFIYNKSIKQDIDKSIKLLIKIAHGFNHSLILLCLALIKKYGMNTTEIQKEIEKQTKSSKSNLHYKVLDIIKNLQFKSAFESLYESYSTKDFLYNIQLKPVLTTDIQNKALMEKKLENQNAKNLTPSFYEGFQNPI